MNADQTERRSLQIGQDQLMAVIRAMATGGRGGSVGREDPDNPLPPGPWDPVIRIALERIGIAGTVFGPSPQPWKKVFGPFPEPWRMFGPHPEPWHAAFGPVPDPWRIAFASIAARHPEIWDIIGGTPGLADEVALNPQPLPPRFAFVTALAQSVTERAGMLQEFADAARGVGREGEQQGIIVVGGYVSRFVDDICGNDFRFRWPFPWPRPHWLGAEVGGIDLVMMAAQFDQAAQESFHPEMRRALGDASGRLAEAGVSRLHEG